MSWPLRILNVSFRSRLLIVPPLHVMRFDFHDWSSVAFPREDDIVHDRKCCNATSDDNSPIHHVWRRTHMRRPETEEYDEQQVANCNCIVGDTKSTLQAPRSPS